MIPRALAPTAAAAALALALLGAAAAAPLRAQQPAGGPARPDTTRPKDPRAAILDRLHRLDARPDTTKRDSTTASADSVQTVAAPRAARTPMGAIQIEQDSIMKALEQLQGFTPTLYAGKSARFAADTGRLVLLADSAHKAKVVQADQAMTADSTLVYNQNTQIACGYGKPVLTGAGQSDPVESDKVCYDTQKRLGVAYGANTKFQEGATAWYVHGRTTYVTGNGSQQKLYSTDAEFTDCDLKEPHYHFTAKQVKFIGKDVMVARDVTLSFADVPVFWLPFMMQPMGQGRHSGILMPRFDLNDIARTNASYQRRVQNLGFFWAINDHLGALAAVDWFSGNYTALNSAFDYSFRRQFLDGQVALNRYWRNSGDQLTLSARNSWRPDERTNLNANVSYASSSAFVLSQTFDPRELNQSIDSNLGVSRRFDFGSLDFSARRRQMLSTDRVSMTLPSVNLSLVPVSLFRRSDGSPLLTWNGGGSYSVDQDNMGDPQRSSNPSTRNRTGSFNSALTLGKFSWNQTLNYTGASQLERPSFPLKDASGRDTGTVPVLPGAAKDLVSWSTSLSFQQRLIGTSSISPSISIAGQSASVDSASSCLNPTAPYSCREVHTGMVAAPMRINFGVGTQMDIYGFWPGVGPFSKIRHKLSPSFSYSYSPAPAPVQPGSLQDIVFGGAVQPGQVSPLAETNVLQIGLNQTFEGKYKVKPDSTKGESAPDTTTSLEGEPRRLPEVRKMTLFAIQTSAVAYNFAKWQCPPTGAPLCNPNRRIGFQAPQLSNSIRTDLIPGMQFNITHDLFQDVDPQNPSSQGGPRHFAPFLTSASTSFTLNDQSWLFKVLGLASKVTKPKQDSTKAQPDSTATSSVADQANTGLGLGLVPGRRGGQLSTGGRGNVGSWNASFTYNLSRQRPNNLPSNAFGCGTIFGAACGGSTTSQMLQGNFTFQPTPNWSVTWQTAYNFTDHQFADHVLTLSRDLHDWQANFDFVKAQNGNFTFQFRVALKAQPDLKFDYSQRGGNYTGTGTTPF